MTRGTLRRQKFNRLTADLAPNQKLAGGQWTTVFNRHFLSLKIQLPWGNRSKKKQTNFPPTLFIVNPGVFFHKSNCPFHPLWRGKSERERVNENEIPHTAKVAGGIDSNSNSKCTYFGRARESGNQSIQTCTKPSKLGEWKKLCVLF